MLQSEGVGRYVTHLERAYATSMDTLLNKFVILARHRISDDNRKSYGYQLVEEHATTQVGDTGTVFEV